MKKESPSTFILNANDTSYFYVEGKYSSIHGPIYNVYYNNNVKPVRYDAKNFIEVHGINDKESIYKFTNSVLPELVALGGYDSRAYHVYDTFTEVNKIVSGQDTKTPKLGKFKKNFIEAVSIYNEIKGLLSKLEVPYAEDYDLLYGPKKEIKKVTKIVTIPSARKQIKDLNSIYEDSKSIQRKIKYD